MEKLTTSQQRWFDSMSSMKSYSVSFDHITPTGHAVFALEDSHKWATVVVGKRGHLEYRDVLKK